MSSKYVGCCLLFLFVKTLFATNECPQAIDSDGNRLHRINCMLLKRFTFNPWAGKRSTKSSNIDTMEPSRFNRDFSSWGGKRLSQEEFSPDFGDKVPSQIDTAQYKDNTEVMNCIKRFINDQFLLSRCIELVKNNCKSGFERCKTEQSQFERREFSAWGGW